MIQVRDVAPGEGEDEVTRRREIEELVDPFLVARRRTTSVLEVRELALDRRDDLGEVREAAAWIDLSGTSQPGDEPVIEVSGSDEEKRLALDVIREFTGG